MSQYFLLLILSLGISNSFADTKLEDALRLTQEASKSQDVNLIQNPNLTTQALNGASNATAATETTPQIESLAPTASDLTADIKSQEEPMPPVVLTESIAVPDTTQTATPNKSDKDQVNPLAVLIGLFLTLLIALLPAIGTLVTKKGIR